MRLVYPNPTDGRIRIERSEYSNHSEARSLVRVVSANGEEFVVSVVETPEAMELDLSDYPDGLYVVIVRNGSSTEAYKVILFR
ncbi:MAG: T9SS type A sorting domain-containing protein [Ignavibacteria bacterium]|nr:T9SS type A sorting domain-containing protein [Ignavibacteria bacterium]